MSDDDDGPRVPALHKYFSYIVSLYDYILFYILQPSQCLCHGVREWDEPTTDFDYYPSDKTHWADDCFTFEQHKDLIAEHLAEYSHGIGTHVEAIPLKRIRIKITPENLLAFKIDPRTNEINPHIVGMSATDLQVLVPYNIFDHICYYQSQCRRQQEEIKENSAPSETVV